MADIYLNNDVYPSSEGRGNLSHSRNVSTLSSATLHTSTTMHSQPTEPLLNPTSPEAVAYYDQISQQPRDADGTPARMRWGTPPALEAVSEKEANAYWKARPAARRRTSSRWRWSKFVLEMVMGKSISLVNVFGGDSFAWICYFIRFFPNCSLNICFTAA